MTKEVIPLSIPDVSGLAQSILKQHRKSGGELSQTRLLNYIAKSQGFQNWQSLKMNRPGNEVEKQNGNIVNIQFSQQRVDILTKGLSTDFFSDAYLYAWLHSVYPIYDDSDSDIPTRPHEFFENSFHVSGQKVINVVELLDEKWMNNIPYTFYELEDAFGGKYDQEYGRMTLIFICKYSYLLGHFDEGFWNHLVKPGPSPTEAKAIIRDFNKTREIHL